MANEHNANVYNNILSVVKEGAIAEIRMAGHLDEYRMNGLYLGMKDLAFEMVMSIHFYLRENHFQKPNSLILFEFSAV